MIAPENGINSLTTDVLLKIFTKLPETDRALLPYVCKSWAIWLKASGDLYNNLQILLGPCCLEATPDAEKFLHWVIPRIGFTHRLELQLPTDPPSQASSKAINKLLDICGGYQRLRSLELSFDGRFWYPPSLTQLSSLRHLHLKADCTFRALPKSLCQLTALESLSIEMDVTGGHRVAAEFLPIELLSMLQLKSLTLSACGSMQLPPTLYELSPMQELCIRHCRHVAFAQNAYVATTSAAAKLRRLVLADCNLSSLPYQVGAFSNLIDLDLGGNALSTLPAIGLLKLEHLCLARNNFSSLPRLLFRLSKLRTLDLSNNDQLEVDPYQPNTVQQPGTARVCSLNVLVAKLTNLEALDLQQAASKKWSPGSRQQLDLLERKMAWRLSNPGRGPLGCMKHLKLGTIA